MSKKTLPPDVTAKIIELEAQGYVSSHEIFKEDTKLRKRYNLPPRAHLNAMSTFLYVNDAAIRSRKLHCHCKLYHKEDVLDILADLYNRNAAKAYIRAHTRCSIKHSHLEATPDILKNPDYMPRLRASQLTGCNPNRISKWTNYMQIIPYYDPTAKNLLYPLSKIRELAPWRQYKTIEKHLGEQRARLIKATAKKKQLVVDKGIVLTMYYAPELAHL